MEGLRKAALVLCAVLMLCTVAAAEWDSTGSFNGDPTSSSPVIQEPEQSEPSPVIQPELSAPSPGGAAPAVPDAVEHREAEQVSTEPPGEDEDAKKQPSAGNGTGDDAPTELTLPVQAPKPVSPVRYILIGALLAAALCIALYLFTHPVREEDDPEDNE